MVIKGKCQALPLKDKEGISFTFYFGGVGVVGGGEIAESRFLDLWKCH